MTGYDYEAVEDSLTESGSNTMGRRVPIEQFIKDCEDSRYGRHDNSRWCLKDTLGLGLFLGGAILLLYSMIRLTNYSTEINRPKFNALYPKTSIISPVHNQNSLEIKVDIK
mgnify:CR=1 FL=1